MKKIFYKNKNKSLLNILGILIIGIFLILIARITYAYFAPSFNEGIGNVRIESNSTDKLRFISGKPLSISATPTTLPEDGNNMVISSVNKATLLANDANNHAELSYYVYFNLKDNNFIYSDGSTPEIILSIIDNNGNIITNIDGLTYGTFNGVEGFDITVKKGLFLVDNKTIIADSSTAETVHNWTFTITYLNLPFDQSQNYNHTMVPEVILSDNIIDNMSSDETEEEVPGETPGGGAELL